MFHYVRMLIHRWTQRVWEVHENSSLSCFALWPFYMKNVISQPLMLSGSLYLSIPGVSSEGFERRRTEGTEGTEGIKRQRGLMDTRNWGTWEIIFLIKNGQKAKRDKVFFVDLWSLKLKSPQSNLISDRWMIISREFCEFFQKHFLAKRWEISDKRDYHISGIFWGIVRRSLLIRS